MTVIGTITHELGHYTAAKIIGHEAKINYAHAFSDNPTLSSELKLIYEKHYEDIKEKKDFPLKERLQTLRTQQIEEAKIMSLGGPLQTMLTGTLGFILLLRNRKNIYKNGKLKLIGWIYIFLSLFWLRQVTNFLVAIASLIITKETHISGDEMSLAKLYKLPIWSIQTTTGILGIIICGYIFFKIIPRAQRLTFIIAGLFGGIAGYYLWLVKYGKIIMP